MNQRKFILVIIVMMFIVLLTGKAISLDKENGKVTGLKPEENIALGYYQMKKTLDELEKKQAQEEYREWIIQISSEIDKLLELAREAEQRKDYKLAIEFCEKILKLTSKKEIRRLIGEQKNKWLKELKKEFVKKKAERESFEELLKEKIAKRIKQKQIGKKKEIAVREIKEKKESVREAVTQPPEALEEPAEQFYLRNFTENLYEGEQLIAQGKKMLEEKKFKQAYEFFKKAIEVME